jgi:hypothetical protein
LAVRDLDTGPVHGNQPLTSVEAFALALVEASSRLTSPAPSDAAETAPVTDELPAAAE